MDEPRPDLKNPWLIAAWPGLGGVAVIAASYLVAALDAEEGEILPGDGFFELHQIDVEDGIAETPRLPRGYFHEWRNPSGVGPDLMIFLGEAQPTIGGARLGAEILRRARTRGVRRVLTFASLATQLHPTGEPRVHAVATDADVLGQLTGAGAAPLGEGQIGGLNGVMLGIGESYGFAGGCLLAEIPYFAGGVPNPKAARAALEVFGKMSGIPIDLGDLREKSAAMDVQILRLMERLREESGGAEPELETPLPELSDDDAGDEANEGATEASAPEPLDFTSRDRLERMFEQARKDKAKAFELKKELDRLGVFERYEDRFLDLFKRAE